MNNFVITILDIPESIALSKRMIRSGLQHGFSTDNFEAVTPRNTNLKEMLDKEGISAEGFKEQYSRLDNCVAAFLSHYSLWKKAVETNKITTIFEHDAVVINQCNTTIAFDKVITLGQPSYGKFNTPTQLGVGPLVHKRYFGGAHAYRVTPAGAQELINQAKIHARPTDVFLHVDTFPWLQEYYPWPVKADDHFSTIQNENGCLAKHNYGEHYGLL